MAWLSPAYPIGAFSYSSGIDGGRGRRYFRRDDVAALARGDARQGGGFCDAVFFVQAYRAAEAADDEALRTVAELAAAFAPSKERHLETTAQGRASRHDARGLAVCGARSVDGGVGRAIALPVAVGVVCAGHRVPLAPALNAYLHAHGREPRSAGVR